MEWSRASWRAGGKRRFSGPGTLRAADGQGRGRQGRGTGMPAAWPCVGVTGVSSFTLAFGSPRCWAVRDRGTCE